VSAAAVVAPIHAPPVRFSVIVTGEGIGRGMPWTIVYGALEVPLCYLDSRGRAIEMAARLNGEHGGS
jgi:hypothetical protein